MRERKVNSKATAAAQAEKTKKKRSKSQTVLLILTVLCLLGALVSGALILGKYWIIQSDQNKVKDLYNTEASSGDAAPETSDELDPETGILSDFNALYNINEDVKGYLWVDGTKLSTVVVQGTDNEYYLRHNFYGKTILGIPFIDYRATLTAEKQSMNLTIYGHAAQDGSYFAPIKEYKSLDYYRAHPVINFDTTYGRAKYKIIGAFMAEVRSDLPDYFNYHDYIDMTQEEYRKAAIDAVKQLSADVGIPADLKDIVKPEDIPFLAQSAYDDACRPGNPKETSVEDITKLYESLI